MNMNLTTLRRIFTTLMIVGAVICVARIFDETTYEAPVVVAELAEHENSAPEPMVTSVSEDKTQRRCHGPRKKKKGFEGIRQIGAHQYEIEQAEIDKALADFSTLSTGSRIVPAFEDGKPTGFKLFSIRPNSLQSKLGFQNGDTLHRVNGYEINSPDRALELYQKLKDSKRITVDINRRGTPITYVYTVVP